MLTSRDSCPVQSCFLVLPWGLSAHPGKGAVSATLPRGPGDRRPPKRQNSRGVVGKMTMGIWILGVCWGAEGEETVWNIP